MSQLINELAKIEVSNEIMAQLDIRGIYQNFSDNYKKLDNLKTFKSEYEKQNVLKRWWHNDKLRDAQLDSTEVQAEFSKTIGQLMMISIVQSKGHTEQQTLLNNQQGKLKTQADGIAEHAGELQKQHKVLADQSAKLEQLVREYFELKGMTEDGAQKLIKVAKEIKSTKEGMLQEFEERAKEVGATCGKMVTQMKTLSVQVNDQIRLSAEQTQSGIATLEKETRQAYRASESALRTEIESDREVMVQQFAAHAKEVEVACGAMASHLETLSVELNDQARVNAEQTRQGIAVLTQETRQALLASESALRAESQRNREGMLQQFVAHVKDFEVTCGAMASQLEALSAGLNDQIRLNAEQIRHGMAALDQETRQALLASESALRAEQELARQAGSQGMSALEQRLCETEARLTAEGNELGANLCTKLAEQDTAHREALRLTEVGIAEQSVQMAEMANQLVIQKAVQEELARFHQQTLHRIRRLTLCAGCSAAAVLIILGGMAHVLKWV